MGFELRHGPLDGEEICIEDLLCVPCRITLRTAAGVCVEYGLLEGVYHFVGYVEGVECDADQTS